MKPSCDKIRDLIIERESETPLSDLEEQMIRRHLARCSACRAFRDDVRQLLHGLREMPVPILPDPFFDEIHESILQSMDDLPPSQTERGFLSRWRERFTRGSILAPVLSGVLGIFIGITVTLAWRRGFSPFSPTRSSLTRSFSPLSGLVLPGADLTSGPLLTGEIEEYLGNEDIYNTLELQDPQDLLSRWSGEMPEDLLAEDHGTG